MITNYEEDLKIDPEALDVEWLNQAHTFMNYAERAATARMDADKLKEKMEVVKAGLDKEVRSNPERFGISKITEGAVSSAIALDSAYQAANDAFLEAKYDLDLLMGAVRAFDQRKVALENLVRLQGQSYFAGPSEPRDLKSEVLNLEAARERTRKEALDKMKGGAGKRRRRT